MHSNVELSVVMAHVDPGAALPRALAALDHACADLPAEIVVVQTRQCAATPLPECRMAVRSVCVDGDALVPQLWAIGIGLGRGRVVALTLSNCEVAPGWAREMVGAVGGSTVGIGGPLERGAGLGLVDRAIYYLRYSAFIPPRIVDGPIAGDLAGDNAAYAREAVERSGAAMGDGFWEVLVHRPLRRAGGVLGMRRAAVARFTGGVTFGRAMTHRFAHGRHFGAWRVSEGLRRPWQVMAAAPLVPWLLTARAAARVVGRREHRWAFLSSTPALFAVASAWAAGEAVGAWRGAGLPAALVCDQMQYGRT